MQIGQKDLLLFMVVYHHQEKLIYNIIIRLLNDLQKSKMRTWCFVLWKDFYRQS